MLQLYHFVQLLSCIETVSRGFSLNHVFVTSSPPSSRLSEVCLFSGSSLVFRDLGLNLAKKSEIYISF